MNKDQALFRMTYLPLLIRLECCEPTQLPAYLGSMLHGILGWALSSDTRTYRYLFENRKLDGSRQDIVNPYLIELPRNRTKYQPGDQLIFKLILLGEAVAYARNVVKALGNLQHFELTADRKKFRLISILQGERYLPIWHEGRLNMNSAICEVLTESVQGHCSWCSIHLLTPLRIRRGGELLLKIDFSTIIRNIVKRLESITYRYGGYVDMDSISSILDQSTAIIERSSDLWLTQIDRYSSRRNEKMDMSGLLGSMTFEGELSPFRPCLNAARILHIGRNTTFGYGQIEVLFG